MANIIPGSPIAFEEMPKDGLLAGIVCLSHADVAHVGNMEDEGLNI